MLDVFEIEEVPNVPLDVVNRMCLPPGVGEGPDLDALLGESAAAHARAARAGTRVFAALREGRAVGRIEVMPMDAAPLALEGEDLWVIRCLWVLPEAEGRGLGAALLDRALEAAGGSAGVAVVTFPDWMPAPFFERHGFSSVEARGDHILLLKANRSGARVSLGPARRSPSSVSPDSVRVEAVLSGRCPWLTLTYRRMLEIARGMSPRVAATERVITDRADVLRFGEENIYIDGRPLEEAPTSEAFRRELRRRLSEKGLD